MQINGFYPKCQHYLPSYQLMTLSVGILSDLLIYRFSRILRNLKYFSLTFSNSWREVLGSCMSIEVIQLVTPTQALPQIYSFWKNWKNGFDNAYMFKAMLLSRGFGHFLVWNLKEKDMLNLWMHGQNGGI